MTANEIPAVLAAFAEAWNHHDDAVRAAFAAVWATFPDAHWGNARHLVCGDRGLFVFRADKIALKHSYRTHRPPLEPSKRQVRPPRSAVTPTILCGGRLAAGAKGGETQRDSKSKGQNQMDDETSIRTARLDDLDDIRKTYLESWRASYKGILAPDELNAQAAIRAEYDWRGRIDHPSRVVLVAQRQGGLVGVLEIEPDPQAADRLPWIHMLYVDPAVWGGGVAHALTEAAVALVRAAGHEAVWLSVLDVHARARHFYQNEGWQLAEPQGPLTKGRFQRLYLRRILLDESGRPPLSG